MAIIAMVSAKGSPGVTTTALACALSWQRPALLAECDPAGGSVLSGYLSALEIAPMGLLQLAVAELRGTTATEFPNQIIDLDNKQPGRRLLLPGIADPVQAGTVRPTWERLTEFFAGLETGDTGHDVIADCGRLSSAATPWPLLQHADLVLLVVAATSLRTIAPAMPVAAQLRRDLTAHGRGAGSLGLLLVGDGPYPAGEIQQRLQLPLIAELPEDRRTAAVLSDGGRLRGNAALLRAAASAEDTVRKTIARRRAQLNIGQEVRHG
jgi:hypothetical protein